MATSQADVSPAGAGVQALIDRLRAEGVTAGQAQAEEIVAFAKVKADKLVAEAEARARETLDRARREAAAETAAGQDALKVAARDLVLKLRNELGHRISEETKHLLGETLLDEEFLKRLILAMAAKAKKDAGITADDQLEILLPDRVVSFEELKQSPEDAREGTLTHFVVAVAASVLRKGVTFAVAPGLQGIRVRLVDRDLSIDVTEEAVATLLGKHLQPRFRALMEGVAR